MIASSFLQITFPYAGVFWGEQFISSGLAAVLNAVIPLFVALIAHLTLANEKLTPNKIIGMIIGFTGIIVIFKDDLGGSQAAIIGGLAVVGSALSAASANVYAKHQGASLDPLISVPFAYSTCPPPCRRRSSRAERRVTAVAGSPLDGHDPSMSA